MLSPISSRACWSLPAQALPLWDCTGKVWGWGKLGGTRKRCSEENHLLPQLLSAPSIPSVFPTPRLFVPLKERTGSPGRDGGSTFTPQETCEVQVTPTGPNSWAEVTPANPSTSPKGHKQRNPPWTQSYPERGWWETLPHPGISSAPSLQPVQLCPILALFVPAVLAQERGHKTLWGPLTPTPPPPSLSPSAAGAPGAAEAGLGSAPPGTQKAAT